MPEHIVKQGETLMALAQANGLPSWQEILDHAQNAELKKKRPDPGILKAGDTVFIPSREMKHEPSAVDAKHPFKVSRKKAWVRLALKDANGTALVGTYELTIDGAKTAGTIAPGGILEQAVPVDAQSGSLTVVTADATESWDLLLGHMDPLDEDSGVTARLQNLGFTSESDDDDSAAVRAFQARVGLEATGTIDATLRDKLKAYYDPAQAESDLDAAPATTGEETTS
jgi:N-acetylmuramoyl-L-alanine amidase